MKANLVWVAKVIKIILSLLNPPLVPVTQHVVRNDSTIIIHSLYFPRDYLVIIIPTPMRLTTIMPVFHIMANQNAYMTQMMKTMLY